MNRVGSSVAPPEPLPCQGRKRQLDPLRRGCSVRIGVQHRRQAGDWPSEVTVSSVVRSHLVRRRLAPPRRGSSLFGPACAGRPPARRKSHFRAYVDHMLARHNHCTNPPGYNSYVPERGIPWRALPTPPTRTIADRATRYRRDRRAAPAAARAFAVNRTACARAAKRSPALAQAGGYVCSLVFRGQTGSLLQAPRAGFVLVAAMLPLDCERP